MNAPIAFRIASTAHDIAACHALRHEVFCREQSLFDSTDRDAIDGSCITMGAFTGNGPQAIGTVRVHSAAPGQWAGSRLAVARPHRSTAHVGTLLIRVAVCYAHAQGARRFLAHVQQRNVALFEALHWQSLEEIILHGTPHHLMQADLACYPAAALAQFLAPMRQAA